MRAAGLAFALSTLVAGGLAFARSEPRTELSVRSAETGDWQAAIVARTGGVPARVRGGGDRWSVLVRTSDAVPTARNLDWDGTLAIYPTCDAPTEEDGPDTTSADARSLVEGEPDGARIHLYRATSVSTARTRCAESPALLHLVAEDAHPSTDEGPPAIAASLDEASLASLAALGREHEGRSVVVAIRRTILSELVLPIGTSASVIRLPLVGGDIAPLYAEFFSGSLRMPPLARLSEISSTPVSPWGEPLLVMLSSCLVALGLALGSRRLDPLSSSARVIGSVMVGTLASALSAWLFTATAGASYVDLLEIGGLEQGLTLAGCALLVFGFGGVSSRAQAVFLGLGVSLGFALDRASEDFALLMPGASISTSLAAALGRALLGTAFALALVAPAPKRLQIVSAVWGLAVLAHGLALTLVHSLA